MGVGGGWFFTFSMALAIQSRFSRTIEATSRGLNPRGIVITNPSALVTFKRTVRARGFNCIV
jgi:hypothetical protein